MTLSLCLSDMNKNIKKCERRTNVSFKTCTHCNDVINTAQKMKGQGHKDTKYSAIKCNT